MGIYGKITFFNGKVKCFDGILLFFFTEFLAKSGAKSGDEFLHSNSLTKNL